MKTETELRKYLNEVKQQVIKEKKAEHKYLTIVGETIISTIMYVLKDYSCIDFERLQAESEE